MSAPIRILVAVDDGVESELVNASLPSDNGVQIVGVIDGLQESWQTLQEVPTDLLAVVCGDYSDRAITLIDGAVKQRPERPVVVLSDGSPNGFVKRVFEVGADDIVSLPANPEQIAFTFEKAIVRKQGTAGAGGVALAPMICVLGPKGGTGKTLTACNLGVALAGAGNRVAIVDLDLQFGDVALSLGLAPERTIYDLAKSGGSLDADKVAGYLAEHPSGVRVLVAPTRPDHAGAITTEFLREVYAALRASHDFVIVDTPPGFTPEVIASIDSSSHVCVVGMLDSLSLKNTKLGLETLELMGYSRERTRFVLNRADSRVGITRDDVVAIVGRTPDVLVPSDRDIPRSVNEGTPIVQAGRRSDAAKAFGQLAALYETRDANGGKRRRFGRRKKASV